MDGMGPEKERGLLSEISTQLWKTQILGVDFKQWPFRQGLGSHPFLPRDLTAAGSLKENVKNQRKMKSTLKKYENRLNGSITVFVP